MLINHAEIATMPAGREMDALVAEKVMGWHDVGYHEEVDEEIDGEYCYSPADWYGRAPDPLYSGILPRYSTDIEMAWRIVEKLAPIIGDWVSADGFFILQYGEFADHSLYDCVPRGKEETDDEAEHDTTPWSAHFHLGLIGADSDCPEHWDHQDFFCVQAETAMLAICRVALLAMVQG